MNKFRPSHRIPASASRLICVLAVMEMRTMSVPTLNTLDSQRSANMCGLY